jgi:hypothetical protein
MITEHFVLCCLMAIANWFSKKRNKYVWLKRKANLFSRHEIECGIWEETRTVYVVAVGVRPFGNGVVYSFTRGKKSLRVCVRARYWSTMAPDGGIFLLLLLLLLLLWTSCRAPLHFIPFSLALLLHAQDTSTGQWLGRTDRRTGQDASLIYDGNPTKNEHEDEEGRSHKRKR